MQHLDSKLHVKGKSTFIDDIPVPEGTLYASVVTSPCARGVILSISAEAASESPGVRAVLTWRDIPGENQIGSIVRDEPLLAEKELHYMGQPVAVVLADSPLHARKAVGLVELKVKEEEPVLDPVEAAEKGNLIVPPRTFCSGKAIKELKECRFTVRGTAETGGQEHLYLETQAALAIPGEKDGLRIISSTQGATYVQRITARVLGIPMNRVQVDVPRLGGAFGGKEDQATPWAVMAALGTMVTGKPVKLVLGRHDDMRFTGKRHPYRAFYTMGLSEEGKIISWEVDYYQNSGAAGDLSTAILERTLFHCTGSYFIPNVRATGYCCRTNLPPNTAFRGFGAPQAMFIMEAAIRKASTVTGIPVEDIQKNNLMKKGDGFPFGMEYGSDGVLSSWIDCAETFELKKRRSRASVFNSSGQRYRKGVSMMPVCFGISFTTTFLNQASALVHVYTDGSVGISTGAVEMGQGVNTRIQQAAAGELGIPLSLTRTESTNTSRNANTSPTAASSGADMNGNAAVMACREIRTRLLETASRVLHCPSNEIDVKEGRLFRNGVETGVSWEELVDRAYRERTDLSSHAFYATPGIHYDRSSEKGRPFAYHVAGTALTEVTVDTVLGTYTVDRVGIVHFGGEQLNPLLDRGQVEGALVQGIGWVTMEEVRHDSSGRLLADSLAVYKVPDITFIPEMEVVFRSGETLPDGVGLLGSKAIGEPPFMYGIGTWFALADALDNQVDFISPMTPERLLMAQVTR